MRMMLLATLLVCIVALLSTLSTPAHACTLIPAEGTWTYIPYVDYWCEVDGNVFFSGYNVEEWAGTFEGSANSDYMCFMVGATTFPPPDFDSRWVVEIATFEECTVEGKTGGLMMLAYGKSGPPGTGWSGRWVILSGTGELEGIHGRGTFWGPGFAPPHVVPGELSYSGWIYFRN